MIKKYSLSASIPAGSLAETLCDKITVPDGRKWNVVEIAVGAPTGCTVAVYINQERVMVNNAALMADTRRVVLNWELATGNEVRVYAINTTGGALTCGVALIVDDIQG